jgi:hypothetical protein
LVPFLADTPKSLNGNFVPTKLCFERTVGKITGNQPTSKVLNQIQPGGI